jgi:vacuolar-type H+-ATPase subunit D/Vma8
MTEEQNIVLNEFNDKIERFMRLYMISQDKRRALEAEVLQLQQQVQELKGENQRLSEESKTLKMAGAIATGEGNYEARVRIGQLVREIDKCITLLNN